MRLGHGSCFSVFVVLFPCVRTAFGTTAGNTQGSFKVETPQTRAPWRPSNHNRQRMLAIITATLGLLLGGLAGTAFAVEVAAADSVVGDSAAAAGDGPAEATEAGATTEVAVDRIMADSVTMSQSVPWTEPADEAPGELALAPLIFKVCFGLGLVVMLAWGTVYLLRRTTLGQGMASTDSAVQVLDRNWLGPKKAIYLVDISGRTLALGVTEEHINVLSTWEAGEIDLARPQPTGSFANQFRGMLQRRRESGDTVGAAQ